MKSVRVQPGGEEVIFVDVVCDCGLNGLKNVATGMPSFKHPVQLGGATIIVSCTCGNRYELSPQRTHVHISQLGS